MKRMGKNFLKILRLYGVLIVMLLCLSLTAWANPSAQVGSKNHKVVKVGWTLSDGYEERDKDGVPRGYYFDYLHTMSYYTGWKYEYVVGSWKECLEWLENGKVDILPNVTMTNDRLAKMEFSTNQAFLQICGIYTLTSNSKYSFGDFASFDGMRIAGIEGSYAINELKKYAAQHNFTYTLIPCADAGEARRLVEEKKADAMASATLANYPGMAIVAQYSPNAVFFATKKGNTMLMSEVDYAMQCIQNYYPDFTSLLYNKNIAGKIHQDVNLSRQEREFVASTGTLTMLCGDSWYPYEYYNEDTKEFDGISVQIMKEIARITGLKVKFELDKGYSMSDFMSYGMPSAFTSMSYDTNWADDSKVFQTQPFLNLGVYEIYKDKAAPLKTVALQKGGYIYRNVKKYYPELQVQTYETALECIRAVMDGEVDCTFMNEKEANYYLSYSKYHRLNTRTCSKFRQALCFGVSDASDPMLLGVISKGLHSISADTMDKILMKSDIKPKESGFLTWFYADPVTSVLVCAVLVFFLLTILYLMNRSRAQKKAALAMEKKNAELAVANEEVARANATKSSFYARMSHDIRTPMNAILGLTALSLDEPALTPTLKENLSNIHSSGEFLLGLVNDVLDMSKIEHGEIELHYSPYNYADFLANIKATFAPLCEHNGIRLEFEEVKESYTISTDKVRLNQIFFNIMSNAVKYTPEGGTIRYYTRNVTVKENMGSADYIIEDTGIGMSEEFQKHMFEPFQQESSEFTAQLQGTGLGLSIAKQLAEHMGGSLGIESSKGKGTKVIIHLPFEIVSHEDTKPRDENSLDVQQVLEGRHILLVEDHPLNAAIAQKLLKKVGANVDTASNGKIGVDKFKYSNPNFYDAILMDIRMPVMDGLEATREIRALTREDAKTIPIIAMTANAYDSDVESCLEAGMNGHISKPVEPKLMYGTIAEAIQRYRGK